MDVQCPSCRAEYALDETLIAAAGTPVRCTKCGEVFQVYHAAETGEMNREDKWLLRKPDGATYTFQHMGLLQQWITDVSLPF